MKLVSQNWCEVRRVNVRAQIQSAATYLPLPTDANVFIVKGRLPRALFCEDVDTLNELSGASVWGFRKEAPLAGAARLHTYRSPRRTAIRPARVSDVIDSIFVNHHHLASWSS